MSELHVTFGGGKGRLAWSDSVFRDGPEPDKDDPVKDYAWAWPEIRKLVPNDGSFIQWMRFFWNKKFVADAKDYPGLIQGVNSPNADA